MIRGQKKSEIILYVVLWTILFAAPPVSMLVGDFFFSSAHQMLRWFRDAVSTSKAAKSMTIDWQGVFNAWGLLAMFCVTFFLHNFFIAPLLGLRQPKVGVCSFRSGADHLLHGLSGSISVRIFRSMTKT